MNFNELNKKRYAAKSFTGEKMSQEQLNAIKDAIRYAPSSLNIQPWKVKIVDDKETLAKLYEHSFENMQVKNASHIFVFCAIKDLNPRKDSIFNSLKEINFPADKLKWYGDVVSRVLDNMNPQETLHYGQLQIYMALQNAWLACADQGIAGCAIGGFDPKGYTKVLEIGEDLVPTIVLASGIPNDTPRPKMRVSEEEVFF